MTEYQKLTTYFGERQRSRGAFVADALLELYGRHEIAASILLRGTEGFGLKHHLRTDRSLSLSEDLPLVAVAVDTQPRIEAVLGPALALNHTGLVTLEGARLLDDTAVAGPDEATKLTVYLGRQERSTGCPPSSPFATCCTGGASTAPPRCSAWTAPRTAAASGPPSSAGTPRSR